jgi:hypothetical protein
MASVLNFDVEFVKPGCTVPRLEYVDTFLWTLGAVCIAVAFLGASAALRACLLKTESVALLGLNRRRMFKHRFFASLSMLGAIVYLQVSTRVLQGLHCVRAGDQYHLGVLLNTVCYQGRHLKIYALLIFLLLFYVVGWPVAALVVIKRSHKLGLEDNKRAGKWGYLYRGLKPGYPYTRLFRYLINFSFAVGSLFEGSTGQLVSVSIVVLAQLVYVGSFLPFKLMRTNVLRMLKAVGIALWTSFMLWSSHRVVPFILMTCCTLGCFLFLVLHKRGLVTCLRPSPRSELRKGPAIELE